MCRTGYCETTECPREPRKKVVRENAARDMLVYWVFHCVALDNFLSFGTLRLDKRKRKSLYMSRECANLLRDIYFLDLMLVA